MRVLMASQANFTAYKPQGIMARAVRMLNWDYLNVPQRTREPRGGKVFAYSHMLENKIKLDD